MKNQYFGDVNDYRKYGLLRSLTASSELPLSVGWMLTPDDGSSDGGFRHYLHQPAKWRPYDPALYDHLSAALIATRPSVSLIEGADALPGAQFYTDLVPDERDARREWGTRLVQKCGGDRLVFLDPDNGFEIPSKPIGRKDSSKYAAWHEVEALWQSGASVLVYQHFCRESRDGFVRRLASQLWDKTGGGLVEAFVTPHVMFLLAEQPTHEAVLSAAIMAGLPRWAGQVDVVGL